MKMVSTWYHSISYLKEGMVVSPVLSSWLNTTELEEVIPLLDPLASWGALWDQLSEPAKEVLVL